MVSLNSGLSSDQNLLIRWTFGDQTNTLATQGLSLLRVSIGFAKFLFPKARFVISYNNLSSSKDEIQAISSELEVPTYDSGHELPPHLSSTQQRNSWWKYSPPRLNPTGFELVLDNDVVLWKRPPAINEWLSEAGLLALGKNEYPVRSPLFYDRYGSKTKPYEAEIKKIAPYLDLNAGILGWPPNYIPNITLVGEYGSGQDLFYSEQGYSALLYAKFEGLKRLIPYSQVPLMQNNQHLIRPENLIRDYFGGHFCMCTYGLATYWRDKYEGVVSSHLKSLTGTNKV